ncbi:tyrosine-type recombinase/integrase [Rhodocyclaceae bacterium SMB388]
MPLTDTQIKAIKPSAKARKYADEKGLYLEVAPSGGKWWRLKYRIGGKEKRLSLGVYPDVSLKAARARRDEARELIATGSDPSAARKEAEAVRIAETEHTFEAVAREWFDKERVASSWAPGHADKIIRRLEADVFPWLGKKPIANVKPMDVLTCCQRIADRGAHDTAYRAKQNIGQVMRYAVATGRTDRDPTADLRGVMKKPRAAHFASITDTAEVGALLRAIDGFKGTLVVRSALRLAPLVFVRPGELRKAEWSEIDFERAEWRIPAERMKRRREHIVPLAPQSVAILKDLHPLTGHRQHVFAGRDPKKPMSEAAINAALRRMGYDTKTEITGHGFRAMARTILHEELGFDRDVIEHQLAHRVPDVLGEAYNRTKFLKDRRTMMQAWAAHLDRLKAGAEVIQLPTKGAA